VHAPRGGGAAAGFRDIREGIITLPALLVIFRILITEIFLEHQEHARTATVADLGFPMARLCPQLAMLVVALSGSAVDAQHIEYDHICTEEIWISMVAGASRQRVCTRGARCSPGEWTGPAGIVVGCAIAAVVSTICWQHHRTPPARLKFQQKLGRVGLRAAFSSSGEHLQPLDVDRLRCGQ
jgi:hypothetical protein